MWGRCIIDGPPTVTSWRYAWLYMHILLRTVGVAPAAVIVRIMVSQLSSVQRAPPLLQFSAPIYLEEVIAAVANTLLKIHEEVAQRVISNRHPRCQVSQEWRYLHRILHVHKMLWISLTDRRSWSLESKMEVPRQSGLHKSLTGCCWHADFDCYMLLNIWLLHFGPPKRLHASLFGGTHMLRLTWESLAPFAASPLLLPAVIANLYSNEQWDRTLYELPQSVIIRPMSSGTVQFSDCVGRCPFQPKQIIRSHAGASDSAIATRSIYEWQWMGQQRTPALWRFPHPFCQPLLNRWTLLCSLQHPTGIWDTSVEQRAIPELPPDPNRKAILFCRIAIDLLTVCLERLALDRFRHSCSRAGKVLGWTDEQNHEIEYRGTVNRIGGWVSIIVDLW